MTGVPQLREVKEVFLADDSWKREYREKSIRAALKADGVSGGELESMVSRLMEDGEV